MAKHEEIPQSMDFPCITVILFSKEPGSVSCRSRSGGMFCQAYSSTALHVSMDGIYYIVLLVDARVQST